VAVALAGAHTFTKRQFSEPPAGKPGKPCAHSFPNCVACSVAVHGVGAWGGCQRSAPTGGAAYGMPSHSLTPTAVVLATPQTGPSAVWTVVPAAQAEVPAAGAADPDEGSKVRSNSAPTARMPARESAGTSGDRNRSNLIRTTFLLPRPRGVHGQSPHRAERLGASSIFHGAIHALPPVCVTARRTPNLTGNATGSCHSPHSLP
jgi:hypothetical protein